MRIKFFLFFLGWLFLNFTVKSQPLVYQVLSSSGSNPGGINTDSDTIDRTPANGFQQLLGAGVTLPTFSPAWNIPFPFKFYGQPQAQFCVAHTGVVTFDVARANTPTSPSTSIFSTNSLPNNSIAAFWGSFPFPAGTGSQSAVYGKVYGQSPNRQYWIDWTRFDLNGGTGLWFSLVFEETTNAVFMVDRTTFVFNPQPFRAGIKKDVSTFLEVPGGFLSLQAGSPSASDNSFLRFAPKELRADTLEVFQNQTLNFGSLPDPYSVNFQGSRQQYLISKSELVTLKDYPVLNSLSFHRANSFQNPFYANYSIKLKNVSIQNLSQGFVANAQQVFINGSYQTGSDWNQHVFQSPFEWDTTQNLLVEICFTGNNGQPFSSQGVTGGFYSPFSSIAIAQNNNQVCGLPFFNSPFNPVSTDFRPDFRLVGVEPYVDLLPPRLDSLSSTGDSCLPSSRVIRVKVQDNRGAIKVNLLHRAYNANRWDSIPMSPDTGDFWRAVLPPQSSGIPWLYTAAAIDSSGNRSDTLPAKGFSDGLTVFSLGPDVTAIQGTPKTLSPKRDGVKGLKITEVILSSGPAYSSQLQTTFPPNAPSVFSADEVIEIQNVSPIPIDVSGFQLEWLLSNPAVPRLNFTFPQGTIAGPNQVLLVYSGSLPNQNSDRIFFMGSFANLMSSTDRAGFILKDSSNQLLDAVAVNGFSFNVNTGVRLSDWNGQIFIPNNSTGISRLNETNNASDWNIITTGRDTTSFGFTNPSMLRDFANYFWRKGTASNIISRERELPIIIQNPEIYQLEISLGNCSYQDTIQVNTLVYCNPGGTPTAPQIKEWRLGGVIQNQIQPFGPKPLNTTSGVVLVAGKGPYRFRAVTTPLNQPHWVSVWLDLNRDGIISDSSERVLRSSCISDTAFGRIYVPVGQSSGPLLMRIALDIDSLALPCGPFQSFHEDVVVQFIQPTEDLIPPTLTLQKSVNNPCAPSAISLSTDVSDPEGVDSVWYQWTLWPSAFTGSLPANWDSVTWKWIANLTPPNPGQLLMFQAGAIDFNRNKSFSKEDAVSNRIDSVYAGNDTVGIAGSSLKRIGGVTKNGILISEILLIPALQGARANADSSTSLFWGPDMIEITNTTDTVQDIGSYRLKVEVIKTASPVYYEAKVPQGRILQPGETLVFTAGTYIFQLPPKLIPFNFATTPPDIWDYDDRMAVALFDPAGYAVDAVYLNDHEPLIPEDWPGSRMYGRLIPELVSGVQRTRSKDLDLGSDWESTSPNSGRNINMGKRNAVLDTNRFRSYWKEITSGRMSNSSELNTTFQGLKTWIFESEFNQCLLTDTFTAEADSLFKDLKINRFIQSSNSLFYDSVQIGVWLSNQGIMPTDTFKISLYDNNNLYATDTVALVIAPRDSLLYRFKLPWIASQPGFRGLRAAVQLEGDRNARNDTFYLLVNSQVNSKVEVLETFNVYPNPAKDYVIVEFPTRNNNNWDISMLDASGRIVREQSLLSKENHNFSRITLNISDLSSGFYLIKATNSLSGDMYWKLLKE